MRLEKPCIIDEIKDMSILNTMVKINGKWYIAKPFSGYAPLYDFVTRIYHAWLVLTDKAMAVRFKEDDKGIEEEE